MSALAAAQQRLDADDIAFLDVIDPVADCGDDAADLVSGRA